MRVLPTLVSCLLAAATSVAGDFDPWKQSATYEIEYRVDLKSILDTGASSIKVWLPTPSENECQKLTVRKFESPWLAKDTTDRNGNRYAFIEPKSGGATAVGGSFMVERQVYRGLPRDQIVAGSPNDPSRYLAADKLIPIDGRMAELAKTQSVGAATSAEKIRKFYDHVVNTMTYKKEGTGWGRGDALWACDNKYGNCTDFHAVLIGMARSQHIPARFMIGFPIPADRSEGEIPGYHCWAELFDETRGWVPVDASEAKKSGKADAFFGTLPSDRVEFTLGRDLVLEPRQAGEPLNFFIYPYAEVDGKPWKDKLPLTVKFRRVKESRPE
jgi:transglutaminase-like putative cysteine protease